MQAYDLFFVFASLRSMVVLLEAELSGEATKTKRRIKTLNSEMITMYTSCFLKRNEVQFTVFRSTNVT